jgi:predicted amidohydrolase
LTTSKTLVSLRFDSTTQYEKNLSTLINLVDDAPDEAIIVAPEVCLSDFDYAHMDQAAAFTPIALQSLLLHVRHKTLILTVIEKRDGHFYNTAKVLHQGKIIHQQSKSRLFKLGDEDRYFAQGDDREITLFEIDGIKMGVLICFELRFKALWQQLEGADIIALPSRWGNIRSQNFLSLSNALGIMNQCYVIASDASNEAYSGESGIITPFGEEQRNGDRQSLSIPFESSQIRKMRRYLNVGLS